MKKKSINKQIIIFSSVFFIFCCTEYSAGQELKTVGAKHSLNASPYFIVEEMPIFQNGNEKNSLKKFKKYIKKNIKYPDKTIKKKISGTVVTSFNIGLEGKIENVKILKNLDPDLDAEAIRVLKSAPAWIPGKQRGKPVKVSMQFPIKFM